MVKQSKSSRKSPAKQTAVANAVELLKAEHQEVAELFETFASADMAEREVLAGQICQKLTVHARIEEEILYPAAREVLDEEDEALVNEAAVEHASVKELIVKIQATAVEDPLYDATVKVLGEYVEHHVDEEETELFPLLEQSELDLDAMGAELAGRKQEIMAELGTETEDASEKRKERGAA